MRRWASRFSLVHSRDLRLGKHYKSLSKDTSQSCYSILVLGLQRALKLIQLHTLQGSSSVLGLPNFH